MFESSVTSPTYILGSLSKDTGLFLFFNLMILSILVSSILNLHRDQHQGHHHNQQDQLYPQNLQRAPSILQRLISLNSYNNLKPHEEHHNYHYPQSHYTNDVHEQEHELQHDEENPNQFARSSSILQKLMFMNLFNFKTHLPYSNTDQPNTNLNDNIEQSYCNFDHAQELGYSNNIKEDEREEEEEDGDEPTLDEIYSRITNQNNNHFGSFNPNPKPKERPLFFNDKVPAKRLMKTTSMRVSCSSSSKCEDRDSIENRRPATMRERSRMRMSDVDEEINEKATDFINKFKQQLRLQRTESIEKYKDMIARGSRR